MYNALVNNLISFSNYWPKGASQCIMAITFCGKCHVIGHGIGEYVTWKDILLSLGDLEVSSITAFAGEILSRFRKSLLNILCDKE